MSRSDPRPAAAPDAPAAGRPVMARTAARRRGAVALALALALLAASAARAQSNPGAAAEPEVIRLDPIGSTAAPEAPESPAPLAPRQGVNAREVLINQFWFKHQTLRQRGATAEAAALVDQAISFME